MFIIKTLNDSGDSLIMKDGDLVLIPGGLFT